MKFTKEQVAEWKKKYGEIFEFTVDGKSCILRRPNRKDVSYASAVRDPLKLNEVLLNQLWVAGDEEIKEQDDLFFAVSNKMEEVIKVKEAEVKKL